MQMPDEGDGTTRGGGVNVDGPGNEAWQRAQMLAARVDAERRRN